MDFGNNIHYVMIIRPGLETHSYFSINVRPAATLIFSSFLSRLVSMMDLADFSPPGVSLTLQSFRNLLFLSSQLLTFYQEDKEDNYKTFILFIKIWIFPIKDQSAKIVICIRIISYLQTGWLNQQKKVFRKYVHHPFMTPALHRCNEPLFIDPSPLRPSQERYQILKITLYFRQIMEEFVINKQ